MKEALLNFFEQYPNLALISSLLVSILIAVLGVLPSFFVTAANILFFGFWEGVAVSFAGEALGAVVAFYLYRKGFKKGVASQIEKHKTVAALINAENKKAFTLSPNIISADAFCQPINRGRKKVPPLSGINPIREKAWINEEDLAAITMSQANAILAPAPAATPFTAATTGFSNFLILSITGL